jgi:hypothetical protein
MRRWLLGALLLFHGGCCDDAPPGQSIDAGGFDAVWMPTERDAAAPDTGRRPPRRDAGDRPLCGITYTLIPEESVPRCEASTRSCIDACTDDDPGCFDRCVAADAFPPADGIDCQTCIIVNLLACAGRMGCQDALDAFTCCQVERCPAGSAPDCAATMCAPEQTAFFTCLGGPAAGCLPITGGDQTACFATDDADAGPGDPDAGGAMDGGAGP